VKDGLSTEGKRRETKLIKITENLVSQRKPLSERFLNIGLKKVFT
jgi:hypothetical protein